MIVLLIGVGPAASAEDIPTVTVPLPPAGVYREPDWKRDFVGYRAIAQGWISDDGKTFWCIADRGEPVSFLSIREGKAKHDPVFLELDLVTRTIVREVELPDESLWVAFSGVGDQRVMYLPATDRLVGWRHVYTKVPHASGDPGRTYAKYDGWEMQTLALSDAGHTVARAFDGGERATSITDWQWRFSPDGRWVWRLSYDPETNQTRLEKMSSETLETAARIDPAWSPPTPAKSGQQFFERVDWRIDEASDELWLGALTGEDGSGRLHWLRLKLTDGSLVDRLMVSDNVSCYRGVMFSADGRYVSARVPVPPEEHREGPKRYWQLPEGTLALENRTYEGGLWGAGSVLMDNRYLFVAGSMASSIDPRSERIVWRYDREQQSWSWPRKVVVPQGTTHRCYSADGSTFVAFNLIDGRQNRLAVYRFEDEEKYDAELAEALSKQQAQLAMDEVEPLPEAEHTIEVSPEGEEVAVERRAVPVPDGQLLKAAASADGKRVALWMMREDHRPAGREWVSEPIDPGTGYFVAVVIDAESGEVVREVAHPQGYLQNELHLHSQVFLSPDGQSLVTYVAHDNKLMPRMEWPVPGEAQLSVIDVKTGNTIAERSFSDGGSWWLRQVDNGRKLMLRTSSLGRPTVSKFEFCKLPSLETEARMQSTWPGAQTGDDNEDDAVAQDVRYDPETGRLTALMYNPHGLYNGRHVPTDYWLQYFDAKTQRPVGRGPVFYAEHGRGNVHLGDGFVVATYEHPALGNLIQTYALGTDKPTLRIEGPAYKYGMDGYITFTEPWIAIGPGVQINGKPGIVLVHAKTGETLGPLPVPSSRSVLWISTNGRRMLLFRDPMFGSYPRGNTSPPLEWLTVREAYEKPD
ncbi:MAG: hypothetical protein R3C45_00260 [Phycisphaerales bacterium]